MLYVKMIYVELSLFRLGLRTVEFCIESTSRKLLGLGDSIEMDSEVFKSILMIEICFTVQKIWLEGP